MVATPPGLDLTTLETPAYVYDLDQLRRAYALLRAGLPAPSLSFYSLKANPHPAIVAALRALGCGGEICSPGELSVALAAGMPADKLLYTGPGKRDADVLAAVSAGVRWFSVDSPHGLDQVDRVAAATGVTVNCLLRVNDRAPVPGQGLAMTGTASQFGADAEWVATEPERFSSRPHASLSGFHLYLGSNLDSVDALEAQFAAAIATARRMADRIGVELKMVNLGGGFGAPFGRVGGLPDLTGLAARVAARLDTAFAGWRGARPVVAFESGRYLAATCGTLLTRVLDVKESHGRPVVVLESGINHLGGMSGLRRLPPIVPDLVVEGRPADDGEPLREAIIAGPLCTPLDTWARSATLPAVRPGDLVDRKSVV